MSTHLWLRAETKPGEERTVLPPRFARQLVDAGFRVTVERSSGSAFAIDEYDGTGCEIVDEHSWKTEAPADAIILGLKELEDEDSPLIHRHIHFAHVYKNQAGWERTLDRFRRGGGALYDLEFLVDGNGRRVAAFGHWAGFAGAALGLLAWSRSKQKLSPVLEPVRSRASREILVDEIRAAISHSGTVPVVFVIGALGRCGKGAIELCESAGAKTIQWDMAETSKGGPFPEILEADVFLNCVFIASAVPPFLTAELLERSGRRLSVIGDVSCDPYGDYNPIPIYSRCTTFRDPILDVGPPANPVHLIAIDHLPSLLPRESSEDFCQQLMPHLLQLDNMEQGVWGRAHQLFLEKSALLETT